MSAAPITGHVEAEAEEQASLGGSIFFHFDSYDRAECMAFCRNYIATCMQARPDRYWLERAIEHARHKPCEWEVKQWVARARVWGKAAYLHAIDCPAKPEDIEWLR